MAWLRAAAAATLVASVSSSLTCSPDGGTFAAANLNDLNTPENALLKSGKCTTINGNVKLFCDNKALADNRGGAITEIKSLLGNTQLIKGYLWIENCDSLPSVDGLSQLRTINGQPEHGLRIRKNDMLVDLKQLENLDSVVKGGVQILLNKNLCYADLMNWERLIGVGYGVNVFNWNHECIKKSCDSSCFCGHCAGPGVCNQDQCEPSVLPDWTQETAVGGAVTFEAGALVGYILTIIVSTLGVSFAVGTAHGFHSGKVSIRVRATSHRPEFEHREAIRPQLARAGPATGGGWQQPDRSTLGPANSAGARGMRAPAGLPSLPELPPLK